MELHRIKSRILLIVIILLPVGHSFAQSVIKLRVGASYYTQFATLTAADGVNQFTTEWGSNGLVQFQHSKIFSLYDNVQYPFLVEYEHNKIWSFSSGVILNSAFHTDLSFMLPTAGYDENSGQNIGNSSAGNFRVLHPAIKIPFLFSFRLLRFGNKLSKIETNEKAFYTQLDLIAGGGYWRTFGKQQLPFQFTTYTDERIYEDLYGGTYQFHNFTRIARRNMGGLAIGLGFRFRTSKHEYAALNIIYEQGLVEGIGQKIEYDYSAPDGQKYRFIGPTVGTRGSNISFHLTFPVFTYNFTKKKFYRD